MAERKQIEFDAAMEILAANCKREGYSVERATKCVGGERDRLDVATYSVNSDVLLTAITKRHFNAEPSFFVPAQPRSE